MRTEGDSWDITTSVGSTALFVATARALEAQKSDPLVVDPYAEAFCRAVGGSWADVLDGKLPDHKLKSTDFGEHFVNFQGARTKYFDEYFRRAAAAGARQVVILAAGLDSRAYRLPWPDRTTVLSWTARRSLISSARCSPATVPNRAPCAARSPSTCVTIGHKPCGTVVSMRLHRRHGLPKGC